MQYPTVVSLLRIGIGVEFHTVCPEPHNALSHEGKVTSGTLLHLLCVDITFKKQSHHYWLPVTFITYCRALFFLCIR